jgi:hypothetical protein
MRHVEPERLHGQRHHHDHQGDLQPSDKCHGCLLEPLRPQQCHDQVNRETSGDCKTEDQLEHQSLPNPRA